MTVAPAGRSPNVTWLADEPEERVGHPGHQRMVGRLDRVLVLELRPVDGEAAGQDRAVEVAVLEPERGGTEPQEPAAVDEVGELGLVGEDLVVEALRLVAADVDRVVAAEVERRDLGRAGLVERDAVGVEDLLDGVAVPGQGVLEDQRRLAGDRTGSRAGPCARRGARFERAPLTAVGAAPLPSPGDDRADVAAH